jgi:hypothetical protein
MCLPSGLHAFNHLPKRILIIFRILPVVEGLQSRLKLFPKLLEAAFALTKQAYSFSHQIRLGRVFPPGELLAWKSAAIFCEGLDEGFVTSPYAL